MTAADWNPLQSIQREGDQLRARAQVTPSMPWFQGHFPGQPILPGVALIALTHQLVLQALGEDWQLSRVSKVRFLDLVRPGASLELRVDLHKQAEDLEAVFLIDQGEKLYARGRLVFVSSPPALDRG